jgi:hypothetical protein
MNHSIQFGRRKLGADSLSASRDDFSDSHVIPLSFEFRQAKECPSQDAIDLKIWNYQFLGVRTPITRSKSSDQR